MLQVQNFWLPVTRNVRQYMEDEEYIDISHPNWIKYLSFGFPLLIHIGVWLAMRFLRESGLTTE